MLTLDRRVRRVLHVTVLALVVVAGLLAAAPPAGADSIVYLKDKNVWAAEPDGSGAVQITTGGDWSSVSQADDGTIAATKELADRITLLRRDGTVIRELATPSASISGSAFSPQPRNVAISPDGSKIAYQYLQYMCPSSCGVRYTTLYTDSAAVSPVSQYGNQGDTREPSWVTNNRALTFGGYSIGVNLDDLGGGDYSFTHWFDGEDTDGGYLDTADGELSPQNDRLAVLLSYGSSLTVGFYSVSGNVTSGPPPAAPTLECWTTPLGDDYSSPSWSPDGRALAFANSEGIEIFDLPAVAGGCPGASSRGVVIPGAKKPDWGPAAPGSGRVTSCSNGGTPPECKAPPPPPDGDGDGVTDGEDGCPGTSGPASNGGCPVSVQTDPDRDGDRVSDANDRCPDQPGTGANAGCPSVEPPPAATVATPTQLKRSALAKKGLVLSGTCPVACEVSVKLLVPKKVAKRLGLKGRVLGKAARELAPGEVKLNVPVQKKARKRLKKAKPFTLTVTGTVGGTSFERAVKVR
jgi:hypothetical protein